MTEETAAAAASDVQTIIAPAESEQATPANVSQPNTERAAPENAETGNQDAEQTASDGDETSQEEPRRLTRNQRLQRKAARLATMVADQQAEIDRLKQVQAKSAAETEPKEAEYNGDWGKYQADYAAWKAAQVIEGKMVEREEREIAKRIAEQQREASQEFLERVEALKPSIPDYDQVIDSFVARGGRFEPHVIEEIRDSDKGPQLAYYLAKNPQTVAELNALSPRDAAREIGRLESRVSLPQPRMQTKAPAPVSALAGGAAPSKSLHDLAKSDDVSAYWEARKAQK